MAIQFKDKAVAEKFEAVFSKNKFITIQKVYWGKLSDITVEVAEILIASGDNQIRKKEVIDSTAAEKKSLVETE